MTPPTQQASTDPAAALERGDWHTLSADEVLQRTDVDAARGLSTAEAQARVEKFGPNRFTAAETESRLHAFLRQYADPMQLVLLVAGIGSLYPLKEYGTGILLLLLTVFNAVLGLRQEGKAEAAVAALQKMMIITARVRRDGALAELPAEQLVPGDIVAIEAGDIVPADGRLLRAATLEVAESALTGESLPVSKGTAAVAHGDTPLGDRSDMVYMNTNVTRGAGEFVVVATGMGTEVGNISGMLQAEEETKTPLTRQLDTLTRQIFLIAGLALLVSVVINLARGETFTAIFHAAVAFAIGALPENMPAVVTTILASGTQALAEGRRDHEAPPVDRDARLHLGDQLRQDRHPDAQRDDGRGDGRRRPPLRHRGHRLLQPGPDHPRRRAGRRSRWTPSCCRWCWPPTPSWTRER